MNEPRAAAPARAVTHFIRGQARGTVMTLVALLRGINVGGHNPVRMDRLVAAWSGLGLGNVVTYLQSGNVVFHADPGDLGELRRRLEASVLEKFGFPVAILLRTAKELEATVAANPFPGPAAVDPRRVNVTFLPEAPAPAAVARLEAGSWAPEEVRVIGREAFLHCPIGYAHSKLSSTYLERILKTTTTTRNWNTVTHLAEMARDRLG
jgi:uncharacterized protein (DUF1697 family)